MDVTRQDPRSLERGHHTTAVWLLPVWKATLRLRDKRVVCPPANARREHQYTVPYCTVSRLSEDRCAPYMGNQWKTPRSCHLSSLYTCCCCCCCSHINSHNQVRGHRTGSRHSGAEEYPLVSHTVVSAVLREVLLVLEKLRVHFKGPI